jgi:predicted O-methyltransferase YrrM
MSMTRITLINLLIKKNNYKSYLEIGVNTPAQPGYSHDSIVIDVKHGVDPAVDTTYQVTSDEFFEKHVSQKYDIIFVDGLHIFDQAYRDIVNGLQWLNDGGTIVVHDCNPTTEITQRPIRASSVWHGDVWKAILKLRMENPDIAIYTVDTDEGCGIIQKGHQTLFTGSVPQEQWYTYAFFNTHRKEILNLISVSAFKKKMGIQSWFDKIFS